MKRSTHKRLGFLFCQTPKFSKRLNAFSGYLYFAILLSAALLPVSGAAQTPTVPAGTSDEPSLELRGRFYADLAREQYEVAAGLIDSSGMEDPWYGLWRASLILAEEVDFGDTLGSAEFTADLQHARAELDSRLANTDLPPEERAALLEAVGSLEMLQAQRLREVEGRTFASLRPGSRSVEAFREAVALDGTRWQAEAGVLLYQFWKSHALRAFAWTPFVRDSRQEALAGLYEIARSGHYAAPGTAVALTWALIVSGQPAQAAALADDKLAQWGEVRGLLEPAGKAYFLMERWVEAENRYRRLAASIRSAPRLNETRLIGALHRLGQIETALQQWQAVIDVSRQAHALPLTAAQRERKQDDLEHLKSLEQDARKQLQTPE